jgi:hypothetical protein
MITTPDAGLEGFLTSLRRCGLDPVVEAGVASFTVEPASGARAATLVETGVGLEELSTWPAVPPHWVHFPNAVGFARSNTQPSSRPGWTKHSRQIVHWGNAREPAQAWLAHVRGVAGEAIS